MSALGMGGPSGFPQSIQIGAPTAGASDDSGQGQAPTAEEDLQDALDALHKFMQNEDDHGDKAAVAKCIAALQGLLGARQKGAESALGVTPAHKAMARARAY